mgnify:CR=1 FL=1
MSDASVRITPLEHVACTQIPLVRRLNLRTGSGLEFGIAGKVLREVERAAQREFAPGSTQILFQGAGGVALHGHRRFTVPVMGNGGLDIGRAV